MAKSAITTKVIPITKEQEGALVRYSKTYWHKYGARLLQYFCNGKPVDAFVVQYKVFIAPCANEPQFEWAWFGNQKTIEKVVGALTN